MADPVINGRLQGDGAGLIECLASALVAACIAFLAYDLGILSIRRLGALVIALPIAALACIWSPAFMLGLSSASITRYERGSAIRVRIGGWAILGALLIFIGIFWASIR